MAIATLPKFPLAVIDYLMNQETAAETVDERDDYRLCRAVVSLALDGWPDPFVTAFYYNYGRHPDKIIPEWLARADFAKSLGPSVADLMKNPMFMASAEIPDWDGQIPLLLPSSQWRQRQLPLEQPEARTRSAKLRLIVRRVVVVQDGYSYYREQLECGHSHIELPGGNIRKCRRCQECSAAQQVAALAAA